MKRGHREDPATPVIPGLVYGHQWPAGSQCSSTLLQCLVDSAQWKITHQELTFKIRGVEGGKEKKHRRGEEERGKKKGSHTHDSNHYCAVKLYGYITLFSYKCFKKG